MFLLRGKHGSFVRRHKIKFGIAVSEGLDTSYRVGKYVDEGIIIDSDTRQATVIEMVGFDKIAASQRYFLYVYAIEITGLCNLSA